MFNCEKTQKKNSKTRRLSIHRNVECAGFFRINKHIHNPTQKSSFVNAVCLIIHRVRKKSATLFFAITLPNPNRSSKFFYRHTQQKICNKESIKYPTTIHLRCYPTL